MKFPPIFQFIRDHQLPIAKNNEKLWFQRVWMPLTMRQMSGQNLNSRYTHVGIPTITITSVVLDFLGYEGLPLVKQQNFEKLLDYVEISYKQIKYDDTDADEHVNKGGLQLTQYNREKKRQPVLEIDFKDAIMQLNTKRAKEICSYWHEICDAVSQWKYSQGLAEKQDLRKEHMATELQAVEVKGLGVCDFDKQHKVDIHGSNDKPYFNGKDVCLILGYVNVKQALNTKNTLMLMKRKPCQRWV